MSKTEDALRDINGEPLTAISTPSSISVVTMPVVSGALSRNDPPSTTTTAAEDDGGQGPRSADDTADLLDEVLGGNSLGESFFAANWPDFDYLTPFESQSAAAPPPVQSLPTANSTPQSSSHPLRSGEASKCHDCERLRVSLESAQRQLESSREERKNIEDLKKKILHTDVLIRKVQEKVQECETHKRKAKEVLLKGSQSRKEFESLSSKYSKALKELEPLRQSKATLEASNQELHSKTNRLQVELEAARQINVQMEQALKDSDRQLREEREKQLEEKKAKKPERSKESGEMKALKEAHRVEKLEWQQRRSHLESKLKKVFRRLEIYENLMDQHPEFRPKGLRRSRLTLDSEIADDQADADDCELAIQNDSDSSKGVSFRSPPRISPKPTTNRPRRVSEAASDFSESESMMSEKLRGHNQLLTPSRKSPTKRRRSSSSGSVAKDTTEDAAPMTHRRSLLNRIWGGDEATSPSEDRTREDAIDKTQRGPDPGLGVSPGRRRSRRISSSASEDESRRRPRSNGEDLSPSRTLEAELMAELSAELSDASPDASPSKEDEKNEKNESFSINESPKNTETSKKATTTSLNMTSKIKKAPLLPRKVKSSNALRRGADLEEFVARRKQVTLVVGGRRNKEEQAGEDVVDDGRDDSSAFESDVAESPTKTKAGLSSQTLKISEAMESQSIITSSRAKPLLASVVQPTPPPPSLVAPTSPTVDPRQRRLSEDSTSSDSAERSTHAGTTSPLRRKRVAHTPRRKLTSTSSMPPPPPPPEFDVDPEFDETDVDPMSTEATTVKGVVPLSHAPMDIRVDMDEFRLALKEVRSLISLIMEPRVVPLSNFLGTDDVIQRVTPEKEDLDVASNEENMTDTSGINKTNFANEQGNNSNEEMEAKLKHENNNVKQTSEHLTPLADELIGPSDIGNDATIDEAMELQPPEKLSKNKSDEQETRMENNGEIKSKTIMETQIEQPLELSIEPDEGEQEGTQEETHETDQKRIQEEDQKGTQEKDQKGTQEKDQKGTQEKDQNGTQEKDQKGTQENDQKETQENDQKGTQEEDQEGTQQENQEGTQEADQKQAQEEDHKETEEEDHKGTQEEDHKGTQEEDHKGTQEEDQKGTQEEDQKGTQEEDQKGTQEEDQKGTQEEDQEGTQEEDQEGTQEEDQEGTREEDQEGTREEDKKRTQVENQKGIQEEDQEKDQENTRIYSGGRITRKGSLRSAQKLVEKPQTSKKNTKKKGKRKGPVRSNISNEVIKASDKAEETIKKQEAHRNIDPDVREGTRDVVKSRSSSLTDNEDAFLRVSKVSSHALLYESKFDKKFNTTHESSCKISSAAAAPFSGAVASRLRSRSHELPSMSDLLQDLPRKTPSRRSTAVDETDDWTPMDRVAVLQPSFSPASLDLPAEDEMEEIAMALESPPSSREDEPPEVSVDDLSDGSGASAEVEGSKKRKIESPTNERPPKRVSRRSPVEMTPVPESDVAAAVENAEASKESDAVRPAKRRSARLTNVPYNCKDGSTSSDSAETIIRKLAEPSAPIVAESTESTSPGSIKTERRSSANSDGSVSSHTAPELAGSEIKETSPKMDASTSVTLSCESDDDEEVIVRRVKTLNPRRSLARSPFASKRRATDAPFPPPSPPSPSSSSPSKSSIVTRSRCRSFETPAQEVTEESLLAAREEFRRLGADVLCTELDEEIRVPALSVSPLKPVLVRDAASTKNRKGAKAFVARSSILKVIKGQSPNSIAVKALKFGNATKQSSTITSTALDSVSLKTFSKASSPASLASKFASKAARPNSKAARPTLKAKSNTSNTSTSPQSSISSSSPPATVSSSSTASSPASSTISTSVVSDVKLVPKRRPAEFIPKRRANVIQASSKYSTEDFLPPDETATPISFADQIQARYAEALAASVETFLDDEAIAELARRVVEMAAGASKASLVDVCFKFLVHASNFTTPNQMSLSMTLSGMKSHYGSPAHISATPATTIIFPQPARLPLLLTPLEINVVRLLWRLDGGTPESKSTASLKDHPSYLQFLGACHQRLFVVGAEEEASTHLMQRLIRVATAIYLRLGDSDSFASFVFDLLQPMHRLLHNKLPLFLLPAISLWPHLLLSTTNSEAISKISPLAATVRHLVSSKLLLEAKKQVSPPAKPMHDFFHEWVFPICLTAPDVNGSNFSKGTFTQSILLNVILNQHVELGNLVVVTETDVELSQKGAEFLKCLQLIARQQAWGWVSSILLESFCLKELEELGLETSFKEEFAFAFPSTPTTPAPSQDTPGYRRALFLLHAVPHLVSAPATGQPGDVSLVATRLCHALTSSARGTSSWEARLVLVNALLHFLHLNAGKRKGAVNPRVADAVHKWSTANAELLRAFCPSRLKDRLTRNENKCIVRFV